MAVTKPTPDEVAAQLLARTRAPGSIPSAFDDDEAGTFTDQTRPTATQVQSLIDSAYDLTLPRLGIVPAALEDMARAIITLRAAAIVERTFWSESASQGEGTVYADLMKEYEAALTDYDKVFGGGVDTSLRVVSVLMQNAVSIDSAAQAAAASG